MLAVYSLHTYRVYSHAFKFVRMCKYVCERHVKFSMPAMRALVSFSISFLLLNCVSLSKSNECTEYYTNGQCSSAFPSCAYVQPPANSDLSTTESQLLNVTVRLEDYVADGSLLKNCSQSFILLYCRQIYTLCDKEDPSQTLTGAAVCEEDCVSVRTSCQGFWALLTDLVEDAAPNLPPLLVNCSSEDGSEECIPLETSNVTNNNGCSSDSESSNRLFLIITICLGVGIPIALLAITAAIVALCCCSSSPNLSDNIEDATDAVDQTQIGFSNQVPQNYSRDTLLMRPSNIRDAFLGLDNTAPTGTFARNLKTKDYTKMTPKQRLQALEFPHSNICITKDKGENSFGPIYIGEATGLQEDDPTTTVYIKSLRTEASGNLRQKFTIEMTWASGYNHPNVLSLLAVCNKEDPHYIIYENLEYGTLKHFLRSLESTWTDFEEFLNEETSTCASTTSPALGVDDLICIGIQIADGMDYLCGKGLVHKDIAARNCHVGQRLTVKIANFGLSYLPHSKDYCTISSLSATTPVPLRWLSPESLQYGKFSMYSDVWSFGVLLWEIFTFGLHPYADCSNAQVVKNIMERNLLEVPESCSEEVCQIINKCWQKTPAKRPLFSSLSRDLTSTLSGLDGTDLRKFGKIPSTPNL